MCYSAFFPPFFILFLFSFFFYRWHTELGPVIQQSFCIKPDSSLTGAMHHHTSSRKMLCCVYTCLPSSWFLNMGADAWHVLEIGIYLLLCNPNEANCISYKITLLSFPSSLIFSPPFSSWFPPFLPSSFLLLLFFSFDHIFPFLLI